MKNNIPLSSESGIYHLNMNNLQKNNEYLLVRNNITFSIFHILIWAHLQKHLPHNH